MFQSSKSSNSWGWEWDPNLTPLRPTIATTKGRMRVKPITKESPRSKASFEVTLVSFGEKLKKFLTNPI